MAVGPDVTTASEATSPEKKWATRENCDARPYSSSPRISQIFFLGTPPGTRTLRPPRVSIRTCACPCAERDRC